MIGLNEKDIIKIMVSELNPDPLIGFGTDDLSIIRLNAKGKQMIALKCDMLVQSTDIPRGMKPWQAARKSVVACISDLSAKGIIPFAALLSIGLPKGYSRKDVHSLAKGFKMASKEFEVRIVGGDTNQAKELVIDCSMIGFVYTKGKSRNRPAKIKRKNSAPVPQRNGANPGDLVVVSGMFGYTASGIRILSWDIKIKDKFHKKAVSSVMMPFPQQKFGIYLSKYFSSSIDSSDGLATSLYELAVNSGVNIVIDKVPVAPGLDDFAHSNGIDANNLVFYGGEEYEIVATMPRHIIDKARADAQRLKIPLFIIGAVEPGNGGVFIRKEKTKQNILLSNRGYLHSF